MREVLTSCLYPEGGLSTSDLMKSSRMGALGAMLMGSRRGNVDTVPTLNFDSVLEEYLLLHGYIVRVITSLPAMTGGEDVTIFHLHGYLPSRTGPGRQSEDIKLTKDSFLKMVGDPNHPWRFILRQTVRSKVLLLLGISTDTAIGNALGSILSYEAQFLPADRPSAFWVAAEAPVPEVFETLLAANVVPVTVESHEQIDPFLLSVCREAADHMQSAIL